MNDNGKQPVETIQFHRYDDGRMFVSNGKTEIEVSRYGMMMLRGSGMQLAEDISHVPDDDPDRPTLVNVHNIGVMFYHFFHEGLHRSQENDSNLNVTIQRDEDGNEIGRVVAKNTEVGRGFMEMMNEVIDNARSR